MAHNALDDTDTLEQLMVDPRLIEMCELQRVSDDLLDVVTFNENQHSATLAWMFDGREGHGQGDEILRDLLAYASVQARAQGRLAKNRSTWKFFQEWPAARIRTTSFGSAFAAREFPTEDGRRLDLVVVDPQNMFILVIENKSGTRQRSEQLDPYRQSTDGVIASNGRLREYTPVYLALNRYHDAEADFFASDKTWLHLGYEWLETSSMRAEKHFARGNAAARLVMSYCAKQTGKESDATERMTSLAAELHAAFPVTIKALIDVTPQPLANQWLARRADESTLLFLLQNRGVTAALEETKGMASVAAAIRRGVPGLPPDNFCVYRVRLTVCPSGWEEYAGDYYPVYFRIRYAGKDGRTFSVHLCFHAESLARPEETEQLVRKRLSLVEPRFDKMTASQLRRVELAKCVNLTELVNLIKRFNEKMKP